ncbi:MULTISPECIES: hypothetical protein [Bhargavaea]|uniref:Uncharacterized protein n=1 Tax=Bhargavaea changchunensis TaxID=2134037 RepID=A0ABW2NIH9_9BACL|nr:hypothetical protein [Bhargavaea sp. CC-171006]
MWRIRKKGERFRPIVTVLKTKKDVPTVIEVSGFRYVLKHEDHHRGGRKK